MMVRFLEVARSLQDHPQGRRGRARGEPVQLEGVRPGGGRDQEVPEPGIGSLEKGRLVEAVLLLPSVSRYSVVGGPSGAPEVTFMRDAEAWPRLSWTTSPRGLGLTLAQEEQAGAGAEEGRSGTRW
jgi:hypothetical protein